MANQEEMASIYKNSGVPTEIATGGEGGASVAPGPDLAAYIRQLLDERAANSSSIKVSSGGDMNRNVDTKKEQVEITWWRQFKYYCPSCCVNLYHGAKKCPCRKHMKGHNESVTQEKKESPRNKERRDRLWIQWCEPITLKVHKEHEEGEVR